MHREATLNLPAEAADNYCRRFNLFHFDIFVFIQLKVKDKLKVI